MERPFSQKLAGLLLIMALCPNLLLFSQVTCSDDTPYYFVDLSGAPDSLYQTPLDVRNGSCCNSMFPDRCIEFTVILDEQAVGLRFEILQGAEPPGALFYQINCGEEIPVGDEICLEGGQEYTLTFCKPGNNPNVYGIQSIPAELLPDTAITRVGCPVGLSVEGAIDSTISWRDITSADGRYESYLSCTSGCDSVTFLPDAEAPALIRYEVCGTVNPAICPSNFVSVCNIVLVEVLPPVQAAVSPPQAIFCEGAVEPLLASGEPAGAGLTFQWYSGEGLQNGGPPLGNTDQFTPTASGTFYVIVTDPSFSGCNLDTASADVLIDSPPTLDIPASASLCPGDTLEIELPANLSYHWPNGEGVTTIDSGYFLISPEFNTSYLLTASTENGCSRSFELEVEVSPGVEIMPFPAMASYCSNAPQAFAVTATGPEQDIILEWYDSLGFINGGQPLAAGNSFTPASTGQYYVVASSPTLQFCNTDTAGLQATVYPAPDLSVPADAQACSGHTYTLQLPQGLQYALTPNDGAVTQNGGLLQFSPSATTAYHITAINSWGCTAEYTIQLAILPGPAAEAGPPGLLDCASPLAILNGAGSTTGPDILTYWTGQAGGIQSGENSLFPLVQSPGWYFLNLINQSTGCSSQDSVFVSADFTAPDASLPPVLEMGCGETTTELEGAVGTGNSNISYAWFGPAGQLPGESGLSIQVQTPGWYSLLAVDNSNGCQSLDSTLVLSLPGIEAASITASGSCPGEKDGRISIENIQGGAPPYLFSFDNSPFVPVQDIEGLPGGTYDIRIQDANGCEWQESVEVETFSGIGLELGLDAVLKLGESFQLEAQLNVPAFLLDSINWSPAEYLSCVHCLNPLASPPRSATYELTVTDIFGCSASDSITLRVDETDVAFVPDAFSPNGDGNNEVFVIYAGPAVEEIEILQIFDRWGNLVFAIENAPPNDPTFGWDGTFEGQAMNPAVFAYFTRLKMEHGGKIILKGDVTLLR